jgi:8-oxo-dGTP pyrophosphatase MutT (NUDIX family)
MNEPRPIKVSRRNLVYENDFVRVWDDDVSFVGGREGTHVRIESTRSGNGVVILVRATDRIALVRVYRYPLGAWEWALPRGFSEEQDSLATVRRELIEELGLKEVTPVRLGTITPDSGLMSTEVEVFRVVLATEPITVAEDVEEVHAIAWVSTEDLERRIADGEIKDAFTIAAMTLDRVHN